MTGTRELVDTVADASDRTPYPPPRWRKNWRWLLAIALAVAAGVVIGWTVFGDGDAPESDSVPAYVTPGGAELTARQTEMVELIDRYLAAWKATDGQRLEALMVEDGYAEYPEQGWRFSLADGSLQERVSNGPYASIEGYSPMLVYRDRIVITGRVDSIGVSWLSVIRFTTIGEVKVVSEAIYV